MKSNLMRVSALGIVLLSGCTESSTSNLNSDGTVERIQDVEIPMLMTDSGLILDIDSESTPRDAGRAGDGTTSPEADARTPSTSSENTNATCQDGIDNDGNGFTDCDDFGCSRNPNVHVCNEAPAGDAENTNAACQDGIDNDGNGFTDCDDWGCSRNPNVDVCD